MTTQDGLTPEERRLLATSAGRRGYTPTGADEEPPRPPAGSGAVSRPDDAPATPAPDDRS